MTPEEAKAAVHRFLLKEPWPLELRNVGECVNILATELNITFAQAETALVALLSEGYVVVNENGPLVYQTPPQPRVTAVARSHGNAQPRAHPRNTRKGRGRRPGNGSGGNSHGPRRRN